MAVDMFLKLDGIDGESADDKHKGEIELQSFSWALNQTGTGSSGGGSGAGKVEVHDLSFTKHVDKSSPKLMLFCANGKHIANGLVTVRKAGENPVEYLKIKLTDILVSSVQHAGTGGSDLMNENLTLNFAKFNVEYTEQDKAGRPVSPTVQIGWDIKANSKM